MDFWNFWGVKIICYCKMIYINFDHLGHTMAGYWYCSWNFSVVFQISQMRLTFMATLFVLKKPSWISNETLHKIQGFLFDNVITKWQKTEHNGDILKNIQKMQQATALPCAKAYREKLIHTFTGIPISNYSIQIV